MELLSILNELGSSITATYIAGELNIVADEISRMHIGDAW